MADALGIARFLVDELDRFSRFKGRDFNSHTETVPLSERMLRVFEPMLKHAKGGDLDATQIIAILGVK